MGTLRQTHAHTRMRATFQRHEALGPNLEEGAVNQRPFQALFLLTREAPSLLLSRAPSQSILCTASEGWYPPTK